jgi:hypothetical protein
MERVTQLQSEWLGLANNSLNSKFALDGRSNVLSQVMAFLNSLTVALAKPD